LKLYNDKGCGLDYGILSSMVNPRSKTQNAVMGESNTLQLINFSPLRLNKAAFHQILHVRISLVIVMNVTCKLPRIFTMIPIIDFVDRGRKYC